VNRYRSECDGVLNLAFDVGVLPRDLGGRGDDLARDRKALPWREDSTFVVDLGERQTPLIDLTQGTLAKCDFLLPTGSFKDRGAQVLIGVAQLLGAARVVVDSSGNAGAAIEAHCARVGLSCTVVVPDSAPRRN
jgi:threonine synthase